MTKNSKKADGNLGRSRREVYVAEASKKKIR